MMLGWVLDTLIAERLYILLHPKARKKNIDKAWRMVWRSVLKSPRHVITAEDILEQN